MDLLFLYASLVVAQLVVLSHTRTALQGRDVPLVLAPVAAIFAILVILNMPLRDPALSQDDISPTFSPPTVKLRTPEDNLTPWQYMTVSWLAPLIRKGSKDSFDDEDVWDLGYEFKHSRLHEAFRVLRGSVTRRLLVANGMDLVRTSTLALIQLVASKFWIYLPGHLTDHTQPFQLLFYYSAYYTP